MGINGGYNQMFCLKLKELRNLNSVRLALQALPTSPSPISKRFWKKKYGEGVDWRLKKQKRNKMFKVGFSSPLTILTTLGLMADAIWVTTGGQGWVQSILVLRAFIYVTLSFDLRLGSFATHYTVDFQSQCQDHGFAFLLTNLISVKVMLLWISRTSNEYLYFLFTHLTAVLNKILLVCHSLIQQLFLRACHMLHAKKTSALTLSFLPVTFFVLYVSNRWGGMSEWLNST